VILVEAGPELFGMFKPKLREYAAKALAERTVEVMTARSSRRSSPTRVTLKSGEELKAHTLVWGAGLQGNRLVQTLGARAAARQPHRRRAGSHAARPSRGLRARDVAAIVDEKTEQVLPQLGSVALQSGEHAGETIARRIAGKKTKPFKYRDKGTMATIGAAPRSCRCSAAAR
jgi:NADH dehydrogenase